MASWISTAATAESTPPERPQITRPRRPAPGCARSPRRGRPRMVQSPEQPAILRTKLRRQRRAVRRVHDLGVELDGVEVARLVGDRREGRVLRDADDLEARGQARDPVAVAHPDRVALAFVPYARRRAGSRPRPRPRRGRIRDDGRPRPRRRAAPPWSARRSRCRAPARPPRRSLCGARGRFLGRDRGRPA